MPKSSIKPKFFFVDYHIYQTLFYAWSKLWNKEQSWLNTNWSEWVWQFLRV